MLPLGEVARVAPWLAKNFGSPGLAEAGAAREEPGHLFGGEGNPTQHTRTHTPGDLPRPLRGCRERPATFHARLSAMNGGKRHPLNRRLSSPSPLVWNACLVSLDTGSDPDPH